MKKFSFLALVALLLMTASVALAQTPAEAKITMNSVEGSKVKGEATITDLGTGKGVKVSVKLTGYNPNQESAGHIHTGKCDAQGPVKYPLTNVKADAQGNATVDSTVADVTYAELQKPSAYYVQYHTAVAPPGVQVVCGNTGVAAAGGGAAPAAATPAAATPAAATPAAATPAAPASGVGGLSNSNGGFPWLPALLVLTLTASGAGYALARQRRK